VDLRPQQWPTAVIEEGEEMTHYRSIPIVLMGVGNIGGTLLHQVLETREPLARRTGLRLMPIALADASGLLFDAEGLAEETLRAALQAISGGRLLEAVPGIRLLDEIYAVLRPEAILADLTASTKTVPTLRAALEAGCGVVLANKIPLAAPWAEAQPFFEYPRLRYEVTVGAGLPVIATLRYLLDTGDQVTAIEGCMSGTLGYLCAELERGVSYSVAITQARALGYTEPGPRDDLSGKDVARKALILARSAGWPLEMDDLTIEPLYPETLASVSMDEFMAALPAVDAEYAARIGQAQAEDKVLRYVAQVDPNGGMVGLMAVPKDSPLGALRGPANYVSLRTARYDDLPLVISGPGAGREVTAAGVLGDIIELGESASQRINESAISDRRMGGETWAH
jgi:homoserine dehydrogenase